MISGLQTRKLKLSSRIFNFLNRYSVLFLELWLLMAERKNNHFRELREIIKFLLPLIFIWLICWLKWEFLNSPFSIFFFKLIWLHGNELKSKYLSRWFFLYLKKFVFYCFSSIPIPVMIFQCKQELFQEKEHIRRRKNMKICLDRFMHNHSSNLTSSLRIKVKSSEELIYRILFVKMSHL